jgi:signal recognition particle GTPase
LSNTVQIKSKFPVLTDSYHLINNDSTSSLSTSNANHTNATPQNLDVERDVPHSFTISIHSNRSNRSLEITSLSKMEHPQPASKAIIFVEQEEKWVMTPEFRGKVAASQNPFIILAFGDEGAGKSTTMNQLITGSKTAALPFPVGDGSTRMTIGCDPSQPITIL